jgi:TRAP-type C4-dicarboxylate transport system permease small subunit
MSSPTGAVTAPSLTQAQEGYAMGLLGRVNRLLERLLEALTVFLLLALTSIVIAAVGFRMVGNSFSWYDEVASIGLAWLSFYGANLAALKRTHMGFPGLVSRAPAAIRASLFIFSEVVVIGFFLVIAYYGYVVLDILAWDNLVSLPWIGLDVTQSVIPISAVLFIVCELLSMPMAWRKMRSGVDGDAEEIEAAIRQAEEDLKEYRA